MPHRIQSKSPACDGANAGVARVALIGAGQLGSRHLQALAKSELPLSIDVVDPEPSAREVAASRYAEVDTSAVTARFLADVPKNAEYDLAIVASSSLPRAGIVRSLLADSRVANMVLEKFLFPRLAEYDEIGRLLAEKRVNAWVNCPRRMFEDYRILRDSVCGPLHISVRGGMWGLACNAIHFIDLASWLTGSAFVSFDTAGLDATLRDSRRSGYVELSGTLSSRNGSGSELSLHAMCGSDAPHLIQITAPDSQFLIDESGAVMTTWKNGGGWRGETSVFHVRFQSELSQVFARDILLDGKCALPSFAESSAMHKGLLTALIDIPASRTCAMEPGMFPVT